PRLVPDRVRAQPDYRRVGRGGARARLRRRHGDLDRVADLLVARAQEEVDEDMIWNVAEGVAWRALKNVFTNPSLFLPTLIFPLSSSTASAAGPPAVTRAPGFDYGPGYTAFQFVFVLLQPAAFGGVFPGFGIARDFEYAFARRLLIAAPNRRGIV